MRRREFVMLVGGAAVAWPLAARAQQTSEIPRFGFVYQGSQAAMALRIEAILSGLRVSGYAAPAQVEIVGRAAEGDPAQIAPLVAEVIAKNVSVIMASGPPVLNAARSATRTIPIVAIDLETDPVTSGVAATLARPGGNITGVFLDFPDFTAKWMEILVECNPKLSRAAVLWDPDTGPVQLDSVRKAARTLNVPIRGRRGAPSFRFRCRFLEGKPTRGRRNGDAVISADRSKRASSCRTRFSSPPSSHYAFS